MRTNAPSEVYAFAVIHDDSSCVLAILNRRPDQTGTVRVQVRAAQTPIEEAEVIVAGVSHRTDASGMTTVVGVVGNVDITVVKPGFTPVTTSGRLGADVTQEELLSCSRNRVLKNTSPSSHRRGRTSVSRISPCASRSSPGKKLKRRCS